MNDKQKRILKLLEDLAWNFNREGGGLQYDPHPETTLKEIEEIIELSEVG